MSSSARDALEAIAEMCEEAADYADNLMAEEDGDARVDDYAAQVRDEHSAQRLIDVVLGLATADQPPAAPAAEARP